MPQRPYRRIAELDRRYQQVQRGMSKTQVQVLMCGPGQRFGGPFPAFWDDDLQPDQEEKARTIASAERYTVHTFYLPVSFEFTFDAEGRLVGKHRYD
jgi:hypothetical protein